MHCSIRIRASLLADHRKRACNATNTFVHTHIGIGALLYLAMTSTVQHTSMCSNPLAEHTEPTCREGAEVKYTHAAITPRAAVTN
eukprot:16834-Heterococcus_DN1.PRE.1